jgi:hypothetical protein
MNQVDKFTRRHGALITKWHGLLACCLVVLTIGLFAGCSRTGNDEIILRNGSVKRGELSLCTGDACTLEGKPVPRAEIMLIGLHEPKGAPKIQNAFQDELQLVDDSIVAATMTRIDSGTVATSSQSYPRRRVAWVYLAPRSAASGPTSESSPGPTYEWTGIVQVESKADTKGPPWDSLYRHDWKGTYRLKFVEVPEPGKQTFTHAGVEQEYSEDQLSPVELNYSISASQKIDYDHRASGRSVVTMNGNANGILTEQVLKDKGVLRGELVLFDGTPVTVKKHEPRAGPQHFEDLHEYVRQWDSGGPGWFVLHIDFYGTLPPVEPTGGRWSAKECRALYNGIHRGGNEPLAFPDDPDLDFLHWVPAWMPSGTTVIDRLSSPDQGEVRGGATFPYQKPESNWTWPTITLTWEFHRTRR